MAATDSKPTLPLLLSVNAGYVDTAGFLALQGLFTAHITGNFLTFGASLALGTSGAGAKLLALPVFAAVVIAARLLDTVLSKRQMPALETLMALQLLLLIVGAALAVGWGPLRDADSAQAVLTGMVLVAAMAIQNAFHRIHLGSLPPSTIMTGTTTQVMLDVADRLYAPACRRPIDPAPRADVDHHSGVCSRLRGCSSPVPSLRREVFPGSAHPGCSSAHRPRDCMFAVTPGRCG